MAGTGRPVTGEFAGGKKRFGSVQSGVGTAHDGSGVPEMKFTSSAWCVASGLFALGTPGAISPEAISWRTSFGVMRQSDPPGREHVALGLKSSVPAFFALSAAL